jgi:hypothetical protein
MTAGRAHILIGLLLAGCLCQADSGASNQLSVSEYRAELNQLLLSTQQLDRSERPVPPILKALPPNWRVHTDQQDFEISAEGLSRDIRNFEQEKTATTASAVRERIQSLLNDLDGFETSPPDVSSSRQQLASLLARPEFRAVRGPSFIDRINEKLAAAILRMLQFLFRSSAIPTISKYFVYGLIGLALLTLAYIAYRQIRLAGGQEKVVRTDFPVSARSWALWLSGARAAAAQANWREAVHLAYWTGISFLEQKGAWRPDRARTPREYLRLLSKSSEHQETLAALTQIFEITWYAKRRADAAAFSRMMEALERLGCPST